jgi:hypothetical protein
MESNPLVNEINAAASNAGISEKRLKADISPTYLPTSGIFNGWKIVNPNEPTAHIRVTCEDGSSISVGTLKALAFHGAKETASFRKVENPESPMNGKFVLVGTSAVNPHLGGTMAEVTARLQGKAFKAEPVELITLQVKTDPTTKAVTGYSTEAQAKSALTVKKYYKIELI